MEKVMNREEFSQFCHVESYTKPVMIGKGCYVKEKELEYLVNFTMRTLKRNLNDLKNLYKEIINKQHDNTEDLEHLISTFNSNMRLYKQQRSVLSKFIVNNHDKLD
jgi:uncharacterized protein (UPF0305 family)